MAGVRWGGGEREGSSVHTSVPWVLGQGPLEGVGKTRLRGTWRGPIPSSPQPRYRWSQDPPSLSGTWGGCSGEKQGAAAEARARGGKGTAVSHRPLHGVLPWGAPPLPVPCWSCHELSLPACLVLTCHLRGISALLPQHAPTEGAPVTYWP